MKGKWTWTTVIVGGLLSVGLAALAQGAFQRAKMAEALGLSPEQSQKLQDLRYAQQRQVLDIRHDLALKMLDYKHEMAKDNPDPQVLDRLTDEAGALRTRMMKARTHHLLDVKKILTPEQWAKARTLLQERVGERRERMRGGRPGREAGGRGMGPGGFGPGGGMSGDRAPDQGDGEFPN